MDHLATMHTHAERVYGLAGLSERQRGQAMRLLSSGGSGRRTATPPDEDPLACAEEAALELLNYLVVYEAQRGDGISRPEASWANGLIREVSTHILPRLTEAKAGFVSEGEAEDYDVGPVAD
jgi:hypothetical protein